MKDELLRRITVNPAVTAVMTGKPSIRGLRVTVTNILRLLASGHTRERILEAYPYLESADIDACLNSPHFRRIMKICPWQCEDSHRHESQP